MPKIITYTKIYILPFRISRMEPSPPLLYMKKKYLEDANKLTNYVLKLSAYKSNNVNELKKF